MPSIRITRFAGLLPEVNPRLLREDHAQVAHNTLLWDGWLKPMPAWTLAEQLGNTPTTIYAITSSPKQYEIEYTLHSAQVVNQEPFVPRTLFGVNNGALSYRLPGAGTTYNAFINPAITLDSQFTIPQFQSIYPVPRTYAITLMSGNMESAPFVLPALGDDGTVFEGDYTWLQWTVNTSNTYNITGCRLYRTIPGFDTAEQIGNPKETTFHLVIELPGGVGQYNFVDTQPASSVWGDKLLTEQFGPSLVANLEFVGQTETGWLITGGYNPADSFSQIHVSERFLWHAYPLQNYAQIPDQLIDAVTFYDECFIGTTMAPYHMRVTFSDNVEVDSLNIEIRPFKDVYACVPGTMVATNFGAMYASKDGLVALEVNTEDMISKKVTNPGDHLLNPVTPLKMDSAVQAAWWNGFYAGFASGVGYLFNSENSHNNQFPLGQLITFATPSGVPGVNLVVGAPRPGTSTPSGLFSAWGNRLYYWPLPGYGYETATKLSYIWRSKVFVMPGGTTFAAAKVVNDSDGALQVYFYGDDILVFTTVVADSQPFRIPHNHNCINWEIEVRGTATVKEIHLATSMRELTEMEGMQ